MDTLTHAVSGVLAYKGWNALRPTPLPKSAWAVPLVMLAANLPDADIFFAHSPTAFLLLHRGITHALAALPLMALLAALLFFPLWQPRKNPAEPAWSFAQCYGLSLGLMALHIYLDCITTYGTMIFLPFSDYRVRLNGMFIVDIWLLLPMILGIILACFLPRRPSLAARKLLLGVCAWMLLYPAATVLWRMQVEGQELIALVDKAPLNLTVLPDALSPLHWRVLYATEGLSLPLQASAAPQGSAAPVALPPSPGTIPALPPLKPFAPTASVHQQALSALAQPASPVYNYPAANPQLTAQLSAQDRSCQVFFRFTLLPLQYSIPWEGGTEYQFYDLRFHSLVPFVQDIMRMRSQGRDSVPFLLRVRFDSQGTLASVRMTFSGSGLDSGWQPPQIPQKPTWAEWLVGM